MKCGENKRPEEKPLKSAPGRPKPEPHPNADAEALKAAVLTRKSMDVMREVLGKRLLTEEGFLPYFVAFDLPGSANEAQLCVMRDAIDADMLRLCTRARRKETNLCVMNYMARGSLNEITAYLSQEENASALLKSLRRLSVSVDNHMEG